MKPEEKFCKSTGEEFEIWPRKGDQRMIKVILKKILEF